MLGIICGDGLKAVLLIVDRLFTLCYQKHSIYYVAQFIFTGPASMKWRRKILTKQRESVPHFFQNIRTVLACGRCTIHMLYAFSTENLF